MKRTFAYLLLLAGAVTASAWLGMADAARERGGEAQLNTSRRRQQGLNEGEVLIWAPGQGGPPPSAAPAQRTRSASPPPTAAPAPPRTAASGPRDYYQATRQLVPLAKRLGAPRRGDWRGQVEEPDQDYNQFLGEARMPRGALVVLPIGELPQDQRKAVGHLLDAMSAFFGMQAFCAPAVPLERLPASCFRTVNGRRQLNAEEVMARVLRPNIKGEVAAILALTAEDMYPGGNWPFESAFGWSSFTEGTAVVSTSQVVDGSAAFRGRNLLRVSKLGVHELAHTFGLKHCTTYNCLLNGCSNLRENDAKPFVLCPDCLAKLSTATGRDPALHLEDMLGLCRAKGFASDARAYQRALQQLQ